MHLTVLHGSCLWGCRSGAWRLLVKGIIPLTGQRMQSTAGYPTQDASSIQDILIFQAQNSTLHPRPLCCLGTSLGFATGASSSCGRVTPWSNCCSTTLKYDIVPTLLFFSNHLLPVNCTLQANQKLECWMRVSQWICSIIQYILVLTCQMTWLPLHLKTDPIWKKLMRWELYRLHKRIRKIPMIPNLLLAVISFNDLHAFKTWSDSNHSPWFAFLYLHVSPLSFFLSWMQLDS